MGDLSATKHFGSRSGIVLYENPGLMTVARSLFGSHLDKLKTSYSDTPEWPYADVVKKMHDFVTDQYGDKVDNSGRSAIVHAEEVADESFLLSRLMGFDDHEATTVYMGALAHDTIEMKKDEMGQAHTVKELRSISDAHDPDTTNIVIMMTKFNQDTPYLIYGGNVGNPAGFGPKSTVKAQLGVLIAKNRDNNNNLLPERNQYLEQWAQQAEAFDMSGQTDEATRLRGKIHKKHIKSQAHTILRDLTALKIDEIIQPGNGVPVTMPVTSFVARTEQGKRYLEPDYEECLRTHLGEKCYEHMLGLLPANHNKAPVRTPPYQTRQGPFSLPPTSTPPEAA
jgi:hypothetical protein